MSRLSFGDFSRRAVGKQAEQERPGPGKRGLDQQRELLPRKAMAVVVVMNRTAMQRDKWQRIMGRELSSR